MKTQVRLSDLSEEQKELEKQIFIACELLKSHGYKCDVVKCVVTRPTESPAYIDFKLI